MSEWKEIRTGSEFISGFAFKGEDFNDEKEGVPVLKIKNIQNDFVTLDSSQFINKEFLDSHYKAIDKYYVGNNEILISMTGAGSVGRVGLTNIEGQALLNQRVGKFVTDEININKEYLYHVLTSSYFQRLLFNKGQGSGQPNLSPNDILEVEIPMPCYSEQKQIGRTLDLIIQKINLLRQQNQVLEELAQTLFKRWFVEFEFPIENEEPYKSSGGKMIESELGEIPDGWRVGTVNDHVKHSTKSINPGNEPEKEYNHYSIPAYDNGRYPTIDVGGTILSNKYDVLANSILVSKLNPSTSRIWPVFRPKENAVCSTEIQVFIPTINSYAFSFGLFHFDGVKKEMKQRASGTSSSHQRVRPGDILNIECIVPDNKILESFEVAVLELLKKVENNQEEIQTLTQLRDTLLPKLMSGELRVNDVKE